MLLFAVTIAVATPIAAFAAWRSFKRDEQKFGRLSREVETISSIAKAIEETSKEIEESAQELERKL